MFDVKKNNAICVLPFVSEHIDLSGSRKPCCIAHALGHGRTLENVQQEMLTGQQPIECSVCYKQESINESSSRIRETISWIKKFGEPNTQNPIIQHLDVRNDPTCNLKCKTCGPYASTLWAKEKKLPVSLPTHNLKKYDKTQLKKVYLAGGEPTYNNDYLVFLTDLQKVNPECEVMINTNLKRLPDQWKNIITSFKNLTVIISCDATEDLGCYVRYPLEWTQFEKNVKFVSEHTNFVLFNLVPSNLTVHSIDKTVQWMEQYSNNIGLTVVVGNQWEHRAVPMSHRSMYIDSLRKLEKFPIGVWYAHQFRLNLNSLIKKYQSDDYDPALHLKLKNEIQEQDSHRTMKLKDVDTFLHSWIFDVKT
jgi:organic radical activating enzyme